MLVGGLPAGPTRVLGVQNPSPDPQKPNLSTRFYKIFTQKNLPRAARFSLTTISILFTSLTCNGKSRLNRFYLKVHLHSWEGEPARSMPAKAGVSYFPDLVPCWLDDGTPVSKFLLSDGLSLPGCLGHLPTTSSSWSFSCNCSALGSCLGPACQPTDALHLEMKQENIEPRAKKYETIKSVRHICLGSWQVCFSLIFFPFCTPFI